MRIFSSRLALSLAAASSLACASNVTARLAPSDPHVSNTLNGRPFQPVTAIASIDRLELSIALADIPYDCEQARRHEGPSRPYLMNVIWLADFDGRDQIGPPRSPGRFEVLSFLEYRSTAFPAAAAAREGIRRPPAGRWAATRASAVDKPPPAGKGAGFPGLRGWVEIDQLGRNAGEHVTGRYDLVLESGERLAATFDATQCGYLGY